MALFVLFYKGEFSPYIRGVIDKLPVKYKINATLCRLLNCQPGDIMEYVEEDE